jgi:hypothetical protein
MGIFKIPSRQILKRLLYNVATILRSTFQSFPKADQELVGKAAWDRAQQKNGDITSLNGGSKPVTRLKRRDPSQKRDPQPRPAPKFLRSPSPACKDGTPRPHRCAKRCGREARPYRPGPDQTQKMEISLGEDHLELFWNLDPTKLNPFLLGWSGSRPRGHETLAGPKARQSFWS